MNQFHIFLRSLRPTPLEKAIRDKASSAAVHGLEEEIRASGESPDDLIDEAVAEHQIYYMAAAMEIARRRGVDLRQPERARRYGQLMIDELMRLGSRVAEGVESYAEQAELSAEETDILRGMSSRQFLAARAIARQIGYEPLPPLEPPQET